MEKIIHSLAFNGHYKTIIREWKGCNEYLAGHHFIGPTTLQMRGRETAGASYRMENRKTILPEKKEEIKQV